MQPEEPRVRSRKHITPARSRSKRKEKTTCVLILHHFSCATSPPAHRLALRKVVTFEKCALRAGKRFSLFYDPFSDLEPILVYATAPPPAPLHGPQGNEVDTEDPGILTIYTASWLFTKLVEHNRPLSEFIRNKPAEDVERLVRHLIYTDPSFWRFACTNTELSARGWSNAGPSRHTKTLS